MTEQTAYHRLRQAMTNLIALAGESGDRPRLDRLVLNNREAAGVLKMAPAKVSQIPLQELPRGGGKGRGWVKISVIALGDHLLRDCGLPDMADMAGESEASRA